MSGRRFAVSRIAGWRRASCAGLLGLSLVAAQAWGEEARAGPELLIFLKPGAGAEKFAQDHGLRLLSTLKSDPSAHVFSVVKAGEAAGTAREAAGPAAEGGPAADPRVEKAYVNERTQHVKYGFTPNDPYFHRDTPSPGWPGQWHLKNEHVAGRDARVEGAWNRNITGLGVTIGVVDDCLEVAHPDLAPNYIAADSWDFGQNDANPNPVYSSDEHGVSTSGVAAARGGNGVGVTGAAPYASLAGLRIDFPAQTTAMFVDATLYHSSGGNTNTKVKNHSYGIPAPYIHSAAERTALATSAASGTIHCFAAGNERSDANAKDLQSSPDCICVAALGSDGTWASYSNYGACVFVTSPSNSYKSGCFGITTTDRTGESYGYNGSGDTFPDPDYTSQFGGTSSATPLVAGVMALVKQVQPFLNCRFAKHLLVKSCDVVDAGDATAESDGGWKTNAAGNKYNQNYGFGLLDADQLTQLAVLYGGVTTLQTQTVNQAVGAAIPDNSPTGVTRTFSISATTPLEDVLVTLETTHTYWGNLQVTLTSPSGTTCRVIKGGLSGGSGAVNPWTFSANTFWGENPQGAWSLTVADIVSSNTGTWNSFTVTARMGELIPLGPPPTLTNVSPSSGTTAGGTPVTLTGTNFDTGMSASFGGAQATGVTLLSPAQLGCLTPAHCAGSVDVTVTDQFARSATLPAGYTYVYPGPPIPPPQVSGVTPISGPTAGGTGVTITGANFAGPIGVTFGGTAALNVNLASTAQITCRTPAHSAGPVNVVVTNADGQTATLVSGYTFVPPPVVTGITPGHGPASGGTPVTISGSDFAASGTVVVTLGGAAATSVSVVSSGTITCVTPAHSAEVVSIVVTNPDGQTGTKYSAFTYDPPPTVSSVAPNLGPPAGGTAVTVTGTNFQTSGATLVTFGGAAAGGVSVLSSTQIACVTPAHAIGKVTVVVTNPDGQTGQKTSAFTYANPLVVTTPSPLPVAYQSQAYSVSLQAQGGAGGTYSWSLPTGTAYNETTGTGGWFGGGTAQGWRTLDGWWLYTLPWAFPYYGTDRTSVYVTTKCYLDFASSGVDWTNSDAELIAAPRIAALWDDISTEGTGEDIFITETSTYVVIRWAGHTYDYETPVNVEIVLYRNGDIQFNYGAAHTGLTPTIGVSRGNGTHYTLSTRNNATSLPANVNSTWVAPPPSVLPAGLSLSSGGVISGTPTTPGNYQFTVQVTESVAALLASKQFDLTVGLGDYPYVASLAPDHGHPAGSTAVTLAGANFAVGAAVTFGGNAAGSVVVVSDTRITCVTPAHAPGFVNVVVTNTDGKSTTRANGYYYDPPPTVTGVAPTWMAPGGGSVTITGTGFWGTPTVAFGGVPAAGVTVVGATQIRCTAPAHTPGWVALVVTNPDGQSGSLPPPGFLYSDPVAIATASPLPTALCNQPYSVTLQAQGGAGGTYTWSVLPGANYTETTGTGGWIGGGTAKGWRADDASYVLALPWAFPFYGLNYASVNVCTNGFLDFTSTTADYTNTDAELKAAVRIAPLWDDLVTSGSGRDIFVTQTSDYVAVRWAAATYSGGYPVNVEVVLYRSGNIQFNYGAAHTGLTPTIGLSRGNGTDYTLSTRNNAGAIPANVNSLFRSNVLPPGLALSASGVLSGTPSAEGTYQFGVQVTESVSALSATKLFSLTIKALGLVSVLPDWGPPAGGAAVTINGAGFVASGTTQVAFDATPATGVAVLSSTQIACVTPAHAAGWVDVAVTNPDGQTAVLIQGFLYKEYPPPEFTLPPAVDPAPAVVNRTVNFTCGVSDTSGLPVTVSWDFGDGGSATGEAVAHIYRRGRTCTVSATATNSAGVSATVYLSPPLIVRSTFGQFNGDAHTDILWWDDSSGNVFVWEMNGTTTAAETYAFDEDHLLWRVVGTGDFNRDGKADYVLRNQNAGVYLRFMNGTTPTGPMYRLGGASLSLYDVTGCSDLNGDGAADVLFRRKADGVVLAWLLNGGNPPAVAGIVRLGWASYGGWDLFGGAGDFNGDGATDLLWREKTGGLRAATWIMDGTAVAAFQRIGSAAANWQIGGAGDYDGDGVCDILWRDQSAGANLLWKMNGVVPVGTQSLQPKPGANWVIVGPK